MSFRSLDIAINYESDASDLIDDFYIPVLTESVRYDRIAGFFTSSSLAISIRGLSHLIDHGGKVRIIASPKLTEDDVKAMSAAYKNPEILLGQKMIKEIDNINDVNIDYVRVLGWLISNGFLDIKIALIMKNNTICTSEEIEESGIFHQKVGIFEDNEGNVISYSGSINETLSGWVNNVEEFKTFKSWEQGQSQYCETDITKFNEYWNNQRQPIKVIDLPDAVKNHLIFYGTNDIQDIKNTLGKNRFFNKVVKPVSLYSFQRDAFDAWLKNNKKLLFSMATGTGKTRTAIACMQKTLSDHKRNLIIISTPQSTLSSQWKSEIDKLGFTFDKTIEANSTKNKWRTELSEAISRLNIRTINNVVVYTTHDTADSNDFISKISGAKRNVFNILIIGDEVHELGSSVRRKALLDLYDERIGLSATPSRWFDDFGTKLLSEYFGSKSFEFGIGDALSTINPKTDRPFLTQYEYHPVICALTYEEQLSYFELSKTICRMYNFIHEDEENAIYERKLEERANITKNAENKINQFEDKIIEIGPENIKDTIVFVSPQQIKNVEEILSKYHIRYSPFTESQGTVPSNKFGGKSERQFLIEKFKTGFIKVLVAIKCLDEGIDIPTASSAFLLASTTNPREYIQRIGRVIRYSEGKEIAHIYDFIAHSKSMDPEINKIDEKINKKEFVRIQYIAKNALNNVNALNLVSQIMFGGM
jgi:superfamily II DNA or RNA helicase